MLFVKHRNAFATALIVLGATLLTIGLVQGYLDIQAHPPLFSSPQWKGDEAEDMVTATPSATPIPLTLTPFPPTATIAPTSTTVPKTPVAAFSITSSTISPTSTAASSPTSTPTPAATFTPTPTSTELSTGSGPPPASAPPDRIVIPAIGLDAPVVPVGWTGTDEGPIWDAADYAAGWHKTCAYPGRVGNTVLSGHHNIEGEVFRYLIDLKLGDEVFLYVGETAYHYVVTEKHLLEEKDMPEEMRRRNAQWIAPTDDERLTLVTCWPYTSNTHRLVIVARPFWKLVTGNWRLEVGN